MTIKKLIWILLALPVIYLLLSEIYYRMSIAPIGVSTVADYYEHRGEPYDVDVFQRENEMFFHLSARLPPRWVFVVPSSRASYIFDLDGKLVDWSPDPGGSEDYWDKWPADMPRLTLGESGLHDRYSELANSQQCDSDAPQARTESYDERFTFIVSINPSSNAIIRSLPVDVEMRKPV